MSMKKAVSHPAIRRQSHIMRAAGCLALALLQSACSIAPKQQLPAIDLIARQEPIAFATAHFRPVIEFDALVRGKRDAAAKGAWAGAATCSGFFVHGGGGGGLGLAIGALLTLACLPVGVAAGAIIGERSAAPLEAVAAAEVGLVSRLPGLHAQEDLRAAIEMHVMENKLKPLMVSNEHGPASADALPDYASQASRAGAVLEISIMRIMAKSSGEIRLPVHLEILTRVRLIATASSKVLDSYSHHYRSQVRDLDAWVAENGKLITEELERAYREIAEQTLDESVLIYRSAPDKLSDDHPVPPYALRPLHPEVKQAAFLERLAGKPRMQSGMERTRIDSVRPEFRWETFPRQHDIPEPNATNELFSHVTYDLKIYRAVPIPERGVLTDTFAPGPEIYVRTRLKEPSHKVEMELDHCALYFWTVRARFLLYGMPRMTEWTGTYEAIAGSEPPWAWRRARPSLIAGIPRIRQPYLPFQTPAKGDSECHLT